MRPLKTKDLISFVLCFIILSTTYILGITFLLYLTMPTYTTK